MSEETEEKFTKIVVNIPEPDLGCSGEGIWTVEVGPDLYEVRNSPWHTLEINFLDVVRAIAPDEDKNPVFTEVYRRSGHRSIHVIFTQASDGEKAKVLQSVKQFGANYENANGTLYAIDLPPEVSFEEVADFLEQKEDLGLLSLRYAQQPQPPGCGEHIN